MLTICFTQCKAIDTGVRTRWITIIEVTTSRVGWDHGNIQKSVPHCNRDYVSWHVVGIRIFVLCIGRADMSWHDIIIVRCKSWSIMQWYIWKIHILKRINGVLLSLLRSLRVNINPTLWTSGDERYWVIVFLSIFILDSVEQTCTDWVFGRSVRLGIFILHTNCPMLRIFHFLLVTMWWVCVGVRNVEASTPYNDNNDIWKLSIIAI